MLNAKPANLVELRTLQAVAGLSLLAHDVQHRVNQLCALCVVALGPIVARAGLQGTQRYFKHWTGLCMTQTPLVVEDEAES